MCVCVLSAMPPDSSKRIKAVLTAAKGKREGTKYVALVQLVQICKERLIRGEVFVQGPSGGDVSHEV